MSWLQKVCNLLQRVTALEEALSPQCHYEKLAIWMEESGALSGNQQEWSFGNGATGQIGIPLVEDWEIYAVSLNVDQMTNARVVTVIARDQTAGVDLPGTSISLAAPNEVATLILPTPVPVTAGMMMGGRTVSALGGGASNDGRYVLWLRRLVPTVPCP